MVHKVYSAEPLGVSKTLAGGQNNFPNTKTFFSFSTVLTFAVMIKKQWWVILLAPFTNQGRGTYLYK